MKRVYLLIEKYLNDGEEVYAPFPSVYSTMEKAKQAFQEAVEQYKDELDSHSMEDWKVTADKETIFEAQLNGYYDTDHISVYIIEREVL